MCASLNSYAFVRNRACVIYDEADKDDLVGHIHAHMLENLLGAFPEWSVLKIRAQDENLRDLLPTCASAFYLATHFSEGFASESAIKDLVDFSLKRTLVWFHYKADRYIEALRKNYPQIALGFDVGEILQMDQAPTPQQPDGGFFRYFEYKGEEFQKNARWDRIQERVAVNPELVDIRVEYPVPSWLTIYSYARHSKLPANKKPYVVERRFESGGSFWLVGDSPFSFVDYGDRYFIICDLLWDILRISNPPSGPLGALIRLEDINPSVNQAYVRWAVDYLASQKIPFSVAVIPFYSAPMGRYSGDKRPQYKPADSYPDFRGTLRYLKARKADFIMHGVAHQVGRIISGYDGVTGSDYEFWLYPENRPLPMDSSDWVLDRLEQGEKVFDRLQVKPLAWEVPHYAASVLNYHLFGKLFEWNYHRPINFVHKVIQESELNSSHRLFDCRSSECREERRRAAAKLIVEADYRAFGGQIIPYRVFKDSYGQSIIPETLGMIDYLMYPGYTWRPVGRPEDLIRRAKQLRVVRGSFASFFWHPLLLDPKARYYEENPGAYIETDGGRDTLRKTIQGIKALGYEFKSISDCELFPRSDCR